MAGDDPLVFATLSVGGTGVISASANVIPERMVAITKAVAEGRWDDARRAQQEALPYIHSLFLESNPCPAKAALAIIGKLPDETLRLPLVAVSEVTRARLRTLFG
jgi:4-hydroxy-tetrahydrodipicolinate synthase